MEQIVLFSKTGLIRYTSHLDLMRIFKRAFRRAEIDVSYSKGFNPHPRISFALPLSLGYTGERELVEFRTEREEAEPDLIERLKAALPEGITPLRAGIVDGGKKTAASTVVSADYTIRFPVPYTEDIADALISHFTDSHELMCSKKTKSGKIKEIDIKPMIRSVEVVDQDQFIALKVSLDAGSSSNLSPELVIDSVSDVFYEGLQREDIRISRTDIGLGVDCNIIWL